MRMSPSRLWLLVFPLLVLLYALYAMYGASEVDDMEIERTRTQHAAHVLNFN